jgi:hypothetical protein
MTVMQVTDTAGVGADSTYVAHSSAGPFSASGHAARLLGWIVGATALAQHHLARVEQAQARAGAQCDDASRFVCDAAGGGSRAAEAARSLRA